MAQDNPQTKHSEQNILNTIYDTALRSIAVHSVGYDGSATQVPIADSVAMKVTVSGSDTYVAIAAPGTAQATATWQVKKITESGATTTTTWADGNANFDNAATDLTALSYS